MLIRNDAKKIKNHYIYIYIYIIYIYISYGCQTGTRSLVVKASALEKPGTCVRVLASVRFFICSVASFLLGRSNFDKGFAYLTTTLIQKRHIIVRTDILYIYICMHAYSNYIYIFFFYIYDFFFYCPLLIPLYNSSSLINVGFMNQRCKLCLPL